MKWLVAAVCLLLFLSGCHILSRSKHVVDPPRVQLTRKVARKTPLQDETLIYEIEIIPPSTEDSP